jgi:LmbE family N-acetylglucosaminyl deacetylase
MNILFIFAHPDDEAFGPAGTIAKLSKEHNVGVVSLCKGNRPGAEQVSQTRIDAFYESCKLLGATPYVFNSSDLHLEYHQAMAVVEAVIDQTAPEIVYTHNISDVHKDHRLTAEVVLAACRPKPQSTVRELYFCEIAASTDWAFGQCGDAFNPNTYCNISEFVDLKSTVMSLYSTEIHEFPDARSIDSMLVSAQNRGKQVGVRYAEAFQRVFALDHKAH